MTIKKNDYKYIQPIKTNQSNIQTKYRNSKEIFFYKKQFR